MNDYNYECLRIKKKSAKVMIVFEKRQKQCFCDVKEKRAENGVEDSSTLEITK